MTKIKYITQEIQVQSSAIEAVLKLLDGGATIPFLARYRKEQTGGLDEIKIEKIERRSVQYDKIVERQAAICKAIEEQGKLTSELKRKINSCFAPVVLEDLYLPYKKKRQTRAEKARKLGLDGLAKLLMAQSNQDADALAKRFVKGNVKSIENALSGARDIIAEWVSENSIVRERLRNSYKNYSRIEVKVIKGKEEKAFKYRNYFDYSVQLEKCPSHRFLAIYRASNEGLLRMKISVAEDNIFDFLHRFYIKGIDANNEQIERAYYDAYKRLLHPTLENEVIQYKKKEADIEAIQVFEKNLRQLLLSSPLGKKRILAIDPGFRTGCKVVCLNKQGDLLENSTIFPHPPRREMSAAKSKISQLAESHNIEAIAIGNGTAGRETENLIKTIRFKNDVEVYIVSEDGASVYSASEIARAEFPDYDITVRGAVSIGRRLMDPLAELVKIDPKSIGVGQYQHEVDQKLLKEKLDAVVVSCVNEVGVELNTASPYLLRYISGLGNQLAENIVAYRKEYGSFSSRDELKKVKRLGDKAFEQCAGFLRISGAENQLDNSAVHPEAYALVERMAKQLKLTIRELVDNKKVLNQLQHKDFSYIDTFTFNDIIKELKKPGRDSRAKIEVLAFDQSIHKIEDLTIGKELNGIVTNVTNFGAFVDIGIKENGLIHKSNLADTYVEEPSSYIRLHEHVSVMVISIDIDRKRIGLKRIK